MIATALVALALVGCGATTTAEPSRAVSGHPCYLVAGTYPDPACTPGATNPAVTQATLTATVCHPGWSTKQRPRLDAVKRERMTAYGVTGTSKYELDHLVPISVGGALADTHNLFPEPWDGPHGAHAKDVVEARVHRQLCAGQLTLGDAQQIFVRGEW
jgi:hypothetical protein